MFAVQSIRLVVLVSGLGLVACSSSEPSRPTVESCTQLRGHVIEMRIQSSAGGHVTPAAVASHRKALTRALGDKFVSSCQSDLTPREVACSLSATTQADIRKCRSNLVSAK
jgi:hypothetical protein